MKLIKSICTLSKMSRSILNLNLNKEHVRDIFYTPTSSKLLQNFRRILFITKKKILLLHASKRKLMFCYKC